MTVVVFSVGVGSICPTPAGREMVYWLIGLMVNWFIGLPGVTRQEPDREWFARQNAVETG